MTFTKKNLITMILSVLIMIAGVFAPPMFGLQQLAVRTLFFTIALLIE